MFRAKRGRRARRRRTRHASTMSRWQEGGGARGAWASSGRGGRHYLGAEGGGAGGGEARIYHEPVGGAQGKGANAWG